MTTKTKYYTAQFGIVFILEAPLACRFVDLSY